MVGAEGHEKIKTWVRDVLRNGLVKAAQSTGKNPCLPFKSIESRESSMEQFCMEISKHENIGVSYEAWIPLSKSKSLSCLF